MNFFSIYQGSPNLLRNGDFEIAQRGTSFVNPVHDSVTLDGFRIGNVTDGTLTVTQDTDVPSFSQAGHLSRHSIKIQVTAADTSIATGQYAFLDHKIEGYDFYPCVGKSVTLSFWVKAKKTGVYSITFNSSTLDRSHAKEYTVLAADTWEKKTVTLVMNASGGTWDYTNGIGLFVIFALACGATYQTTKDAWQSGVYLASSSQVNALDNTANYINLAQVKLEIGSVATPFVPETYAASLARNQRYYYRKTGGVAPIIGFGRANSATQGFIQCTLPTTMRDVPAIGNSTFANFTLLAGTLTSFSINVISTKNDVVLTLVATGMTSGQPIMLYGNSATDYVEFISEL